MKRGISNLRVIFKFEHKGTPYEAEVLEDRVRCHPDEPAPWEITRASEMLGAMRAFTRRMERSKIDLAACRKLIKELK